MVGAEPSTYFDEPPFTTRDVPSLVKPLEFPITSSNRIKHIPIKRNDEALAKSTEDPINEYTVRSKTIKEPTDYTNVCGYV